MSPIFSRRTLRQRLGREFLRDTVVGTTSGSWGTTAGSCNIVDSSQADPTASGEQLYHRHWMRLLGSTGKLQDLRVGSFNTGSGAYLSAVTLVTTVFSGMPFEVHALLDPAEKDRALDAVIKDVRTMQEVPLWATDQSHIYSLGANVREIANVRYFSDPTHSLDRGEHAMEWWKFTNTASGSELRIAPSLPASYQLVVEALIEVSLGAGDLATVNLLGDEPIMWGAAARCYWLLEARSPGQEAKLYRERRAEAAREYTRLSQRFMPKTASRIMLDERY